MASSEEYEPSPAAAVNRKLIRKFREQIHALGALWIFIGCLATAVAVIALQGNRELADRVGGNQEVLLILVGAIGLTWLALGVLTCLKYIGAVYIALVLSYVSLVAQVLRLNICGAVILVIVILQAHRVIGWSRQMRAAGVPLTAKPPPRQGVQ